MIKKLSLIKVGECISYVESLGYRLTTRGRGFYQFKILDKSKRPEHNWEMNWTLNEMRHAVKYGC